MTKTMKIAFAIITGTVALAGRVTADPAPIIVESRLGNAQSIPISDNTPMALTSIVLTQGNWIVSGQINIYYEVRHAGVVWTGGNISEGAPMLSDDGTTLFTSHDITRSSNFMFGEGLPSREIIVPANGANVYLVVYSLQWQPPGAVRAWGFISAQKVQD